MIIPKETLIIADKPFSHGFFSDIYKVELNGKIYCYKEFNQRYPDDIINNLVEMTYEDFSVEFLTPLFMVLNENGQRYCGYLTEYKENFKKIDKTNKIQLLKNARNIISKFHIDYGRVHGDLTPSNMLFDENGNAYLLDFDSSLKTTQKLGSNNSFLWPVKDFLRLYPLDFSVDAYIFNITTLAVLNNIDITYMLRQMASGNIMIPEINKKIKRLSDELLLKDIRKPYSGEYIIDYV